MEFYRNNLKRKLDQLEEERKSLISEIDTMEANEANELRRILYAFEEEHETIVTTKQCQELLDKFPDTCKETMIKVDIPYSFELRGYKGREPEPRPLDHERVYDTIFDSLSKNEEHHIPDSLIYHVEEAYSYIHINTRDASINYDEQPMIGSHTFPMEFFIYKNTKRSADTVDESSDDENGKESVIQEGATSAEKETA